MPYITTGEIAETHRVSVRTVQRMIDAGQLPVAQKLPGRTGARLFDPELVAKVFAARGQRETAKTQ